MPSNPLFFAVMTRILGTAERWGRTGTERPTAVGATADSPEHFDIVRAMGMAAHDGEPAPTEAPGGSRGRYLTRMVPKMGRSMVGVLRSAQTLSRNPAEPRRQLSAGEVAEVERVARRYGADLVGYTRLDPDYVFAGHRVLDRNVIVLAMEMAQEDMAKAPHFDSGVEVHRVYADLGLAAFKVAKHLRRLGVAAQAGPALGGDTAYPPLAEAAGLGKVGYNGLLLTDEFGPRVRLAAVYCSVDTLPFHDREDTRHDWIRGFCQMCRACVRKCPTEAIYDTAIERPNGALSHIDIERCFPYFQANYGCAVCIRVCPFSTAEPERLRAGYERWLDRGKPVRASDVPAVTGAAAGGYPAAEPPAAVPGPRQAAVARSAAASTAAGPPSGQPE